MLLSSHVLEDVERTCDEVVVLSSGRVTAQQPVSARDSAGPVVVQVTGDAGAFAAALRDRDWAALRRVIGEDVVAIDHRPLGFGTIEGRDAFVDYVQGMIAVAPDINLEMTRMLRRYENGIVAELRWHGTSAGAPIESTYAIDARVADGRLVHAEFFEIGDPRVAAPS